MENDLQKMLSNALSKREEAVQALFFYATVKQLVDEFRSAPEAQQNVLKRKHGYGINFAVQLVNHIDFPVRRLDDITQGNAFDCIIKNNAEKLAILKYGMRTGLVTCGLPSSATLTSSEVLLSGKYEVVKPDGDEGQLSPFNMKLQVNPITGQASVTLSFGSEEVAPKFTFGPDVLDSLFIHRVIAKALDKNVSLIRVYELVDSDSELITLKCKKSKVCISISPTPEGEDGDYNLEYLIGNPTEEIGSISDKFLDVVYGIHEDL